MIYYHQKICYRKKIGALGEYNANYRQRPGLHSSRNQIRLIAHLLGDTQNPFAHLRRYVLALVHYQGDGRMCYASTPCDIFYCNGCFLPHNFNLIKSNNFVLIAYFSKRSVFQTKRYHMHLLLSMFMGYGINFTLQAKSVRKVGGDKMRTLFEQVPSWT